jgi:hypothetical protein
VLVMSEIIDISGLVSGFYKGCYSAVNIPSVYNIAQVVFTEGSNPIVLIYSVKDFPGFIPVEEGERYIRENIENLTINSKGPVIKINYTPKGYHNIILFVISSQEKELSAPVLRIKLKNYLKAKEMF